MTDQWQDIPPDDRAPLIGTRPTAAQFKAARLALGLQQDELGEVLGYSRWSVWHFENGRRGIPKVVGLAIGYLLSEKRRRPQ